MISKLPNNVRIMGKKIVRYDDATNMYGRETYRNVCRKYTKHKNSFGRNLLRQNTNTIYDREVKLSMWTGLNWLKIFVSEVI